MASPRRVKLAFEYGLLDERQFEAVRRLAGEEGDPWQWLLDRGWIGPEQASYIERIAGSIDFVHDTIEGYEIGSRIGNGGMGIIYRATHPEHGEAAIKVLARRPDIDDELRARFSREIHALQELDHPHIITYRGSGAIDGHPYLIMDYINGISLQEWIDEVGQVDEREGRVLLRQLADAMRYAWSNGFVHRDIKPSNILLDAPREGHGEPFRAVLCDFGVVKYRDDSAGFETAQRMAVGTPQYMSPEQARGKGGIDTRDDIYALGATLTCAMLGRNLYRAPSTTRLLISKVQQEPDFSQLMRCGCSSGFASLLADMQRLAIDERLNDWRAVSDRLEALSPLPEMPFDPRRGSRRWHRHPSGRAPPEESVQASSGTGLSLGTIMIFGMLVVLAITLLVIAMSD